MSIEDDVERVRQVTEKMFGPRMVWVLTLSGDHGPETYVFATQESGLQHAIDDMKNFHLWGLEGGAWTTELSAHGYVTIDGRYHYALREHEVMS